MKKILLATIITSAVTLTASAQSKISIGPSAGFGHTWVSNVPGDTKYKPYGNVGASLTYSAAPHFGIGVDAKYSFEGTKTELASTKSALDLDYIRIPVKAIYFFNKLGNTVRPKVFAGPSFGFLTSAKQDDVDVKSSLNSFDFGLTGGVGFNVRLVANTWFNADLTYNHGLSKIQDNTTFRNRNLGVNVGVNFGL